MPTQTGGFIPRLSYWRTEFDERVAASVGQQARVVLLRPGEPTCADGPCLLQLAAKYGADAVVWASAVVDRETPPNYHLALRTYNRDDDKTRVDEQLCRVCGEQQATDALAAMASHVQPHILPVAIEPTHPNEPSHPPQPPAHQPPTVPAHDGTTTQPGSGLSPGALGALAAVTAVVGAGGIVLAALGGKYLSDDGKPTCGSGLPSQCPTIFDTKTQGLAMLVPGVVLTVGAAIALGVELHALGKAKRRRYGISPALGPTEAGVVIGGTW